MSTFLKIQLEGRQMPKKFWDYNTNPITGYKIKDEIEDDAWHYNKSRLTVKMAAHAIKQIKEYENK